MPELLYRTDIILVILASALATYLTRIGGYVLVSRLKRIPPRVEAGLNAVPVAVLTTLVAPAFFSGGNDTRIAMVVALIVSLRFPGIIMLAAGWLVAILIRNYTGL